MNRSSLSLVAIFLILGTPVLASSPLGARFPALSPDGASLAFSYQGDVWVLGPESDLAHRITDHVGYDSSPAWSPDGRWVAFSSDREGSLDVYVLPAEGGSPRRLTFLDVEDHVAGWSPDGREVVFTSYGRHRSGSLYAVSLEGGLPRRLLRQRCRSASLSPDGALAFSFGRYNWQRKGGTGTAGSQIWIQAGGETRQVTRYEGDDRWPHWIGGSGALLFVSHRKGTPNLFRLTPGDGALRQLTFHEGDMVRFPTVSADGLWAAYVYAGQLWKLSLQGGDPFPVEMRIPWEPKTGPLTRLTLTDGATDFAPSPDGRQMALVLRGEVFVTYVEDGDEARNVSEHIASDSQPVWSHDGRTLYFQSHREGPNGLFAVTSTDAEEPDLAVSRHREIRRITPEKVGWVEDFQPSPDGRWMALITEEPDTLWVMPTEGGKKRKLDQAPSLARPIWSPDSRWIAYTHYDGRANEDVLVVPAAGGEPRNVSVSNFDDFGARFTPDGKQLLWISRRRENLDIFGVWLTLEEHQKTRADRKAEERREKRGDAKTTDAGEEESGKTGGKGGEKEPEVPAVEIDFLRIDERARRLVAGPGHESMLRITADSKHLVYRGEGSSGAGLYRSKIDGSEPALIAGGLDPEDMVLVQGDRLFLRTEAGGVTSMKADGSDRKPVPYRAKLELDRRKERGEVLREVRDLLRLYFYDADMHGAAWRELYAHYAPMVAACETDQDAYALMRLLIGELNASHTGLWPDRQGPEGPSYGMVGWELEGDAGRYRVSYVLPGSPAAREGSRIEAGDYLLAIDGQEIREGENWYPLLADKVDEEIEIRVAAKPSGKGARTVVLRPTSTGAAWNLIYEDRIHRNRQAVDEWSKGRLGYTHIRSMGQRSLRTFQTDILARFPDREGMVIDVRGNPGGYLHDDLVNLLRRTPYAISRPRGMPERPEPHWNWLKPVILLVDADSFSDAEIFPYLFRQLELGLVVGVPTTGGVIGTGGTHLIDGSWLRLPGTGWFGPDGTNLEGTGAGVDILVRNPPVVETAEEDLQLQRAVQELLAQVDS